MSFALALTIALQAASAAAPPPAPAVGPGWEPFLFNPGAAIMYVDTSRVRRMGNVAQAPVYLINERPSGEGIKSMALVMDIDCRAHTSTLIESHAYGSRGEHLFGGPYPVAQRQALQIPPGGDDARLEQLACAAGQPRP